VEAYQIVVRIFDQLTVKGARFCRKHELWVFIFTTAYFLLSIFIPYPAFTESLAPLFVPVVPWLSLLILYKTPYKRKIPILRSALWFSAILFFLGGTGTWYWTFIRILEQNFGTFGSTQGALLFATGPLDRSIQGFLLGVMLGPIIAGLAPIVIDRYDRWNHSLTPSLDIRLLGFDQAIFELVKTSLRYGALPFLIIYGNIWPSRLLICEPSGFPEIAKAFVGLMFIITFAPGLLRYSNPNSSFAKAVRNFFRWPELPRSLPSLIISLFAIWAVGITASTYWSDCIVKTAIGSVFPLFLLAFVQYSALTMAPAFCALIGSCFLIEISVQGYWNVSQRRKRASILVAFVGLLFGILLPFYTDFTEFIVMTTRIPISSFSWMSFAYSYGPNLLFLYTAIVVGLVFLLNKMIPPRSDLVTIFIGSMIGIAFVMAVSSSAAYAALSGNKWGPMWVPFMTILNFVVLGFTLSIRPTHLPRNTGWGRDCERLKLNR
jgi:hypothetical protein